MLLLVWLPSSWRDCRLGWLRQWVLSCYLLMLQLLLKVSRKRQLLLLQFLSLLC